MIGALVAWRSSVADDGAGDADFAGLRASVRAEETRAQNNVNAYENYGSYANYRRYSEMSNLIEADQATAPEQDKSELERQRADDNDLLISNQRLFSNKFLDRDGSYNVKRLLGVARLIGERIQRADFGELCRQLRWRDGCASGALALHWRWPFFEYAYTCSVV